MRLEPDWFPLARGFDPELGAKVPRSHTDISNCEKIMMTMADDIDKYRQYAAECRRLAAKSSPKDKAILLEIADAWIACADGAERSSADWTNEEGAAG